jgi:hypothetical protein
MDRIAALLFTLPLLLVLSRAGRHAPVLRASARSGSVVVVGRDWLRAVLWLPELRRGERPSWLVAGTFQLTVIAGMLCAPLLTAMHARAFRARRSRSDWWSSPACC